MAEFMFKELVNDAGLENEFKADSAAVSTEETGNGIYPPAKECMRRHGVPFGRHHARQITDEDIERYDEIYLMDRNNIRWLKHVLKDPDKALGKSRLLMSLTGEERDVADPWYTGDFEQTFRDINSALPYILKGNRAVGGTRHFV